MRWYKHYINTQELSSTTWILQYWTVSSFCWFVDSNLSWRAQRCSLKGCDSLALGMGAGRWGWKEFQCHTGSVRGLVNLPHGWMNEKCTSRMLVSTVCGIILVRVWFSILASHTCNTYATGCTYSRTDKTTNNDDMFCCTELRLSARQPL